MRALSFFATRYASGDQGARCTKSPPVWLTPGTGDSESPDPAARRDRGPQCRSFRA